MAVAVPGVRNKAKRGGVGAETDHKNGDSSAVSQDEEQEQEEQEEDLGDKCKWLISRLMSYLRNNGIDTDKLWWEMKALILRTLLVLVGETRAHPSLFELFGFDILLDQDCTDNSADLFYYHYFNFSPPQ